MITANESSVFKHANWLPPLWGWKQPLATQAGHRFQVDGDHCKPSERLPSDVVHSTLRFLQSTLGSEAAACAAEDFKIFPLSKFPPLPWDNTQFNSFSNKSWLFLKDIFPTSPLIKNFPEIKNEKCFFVCMGITYSKESSVKPNETENKLGVLTQCFC